MRDKIVRLFKALGIYESYVNLWNRTIGAHKSKQAWLKRDSEKRLKRKVEEVGADILEKSEGKKIVFVGYNAFADSMK